MNLVEDPRAAGEIRRYHSWAVHRDQSVGEHSWQVIRILLTVWPAAPRNVIIHGVTHDMGEMSGDIQYPFKVMFPELRAGADKAENYVRASQQKTLGAPEVKHPLSPFEQQIFKACDNIEMWENCLREVNLGNRYALIMAERMMSAIAGNMAKLMEMREHQQYMQNDGVVPAIHRYINTRTAMEKF